MAASPILPDSSYYITLLRRGEDPLQKLALAAATRDLATCGVIRCEVGRGLCAPKLRARLHEFWDAMVNVPTDHRLWTEAERMAWDLDRKGIFLPLTDIVIACCARRIGAVILSFDKHFRDIPGTRVTSELEF